jgi:hypothetical protein
MDGPSVCGSDSTLVSCYERLRRQALGARDWEGRGLGLALLVREGMKSWMQTLSQYVTRGPAISTTQADVEDVSPSQLSREVVVILASMALGATTRRQGNDRRNAPESKSKPPEA